MNCKCSEAPVQTKERRKTILLKKPCSYSVIRTPLIDSDGRVSNRQTTLEKEGGDREGGKVKTKTEDARGRVG